MRTSLLAAALALLGLALPLEAEAFVVVRARTFYHPVAVVAVAAAVTAPIYYQPASVVVTQQAPAPLPAAPPLTTPLPLNTTMWALPSGCSQVAAGTQAFYVCGPNWLKAYPGVNGSPTYYGIVAPP